uniref:Uncharacterized protein n=1 Tax=Tetradesmus obliquus TaxID=3088 RepID=A0A383WM83_TETOB|eukprot:jgi/Sobl393_1/10413/SZX78244.1
MAFVKVALTADTLLECVDTIEDPMMIRNLLKAVKTRKSVVCSNNNPYMFFMSYKSKELKKASQCGNMFPTDKGIMGKVAAAWALFSKEEKAEFKTILKELGSECLCARFAEIEEGRREAAAADFP